MSDWISVKDRMPKDGEYVITLWSGIVQHHMYAVSDGEWWPDCDGDPARLETFSHWMTKPEPPK